MDVMGAVEIASACLGIALGMLLCISPRFGPASYLVALTVLLASASSAALALAPVLGFSPDAAVSLAFSSLLLCGAIGWLTSYTVERADCFRRLENNRWFFSIIPAISPLLIIGLYIFRPKLETDLPVG